MRSTAKIWITSAALLGSMIFAQQDRNPPSVNPFARDEKAISEGHAIFNRSCTVCHGLDGVAGGRGPALGPGRSYVLRSDEAIFGAIQKGISGTEMPPS